MGLSRSREKRRYVAQVVYGPTTQPPSDATTIAWSLPLRKVTCALDACVCAHPFAFIPAPSLLERN